LTELRGVQSRALALTLETYINHPMTPLNGQSAPVVEQHQLLWASLAFTIT
jgi:hypothetical protein